MSKQSRMQTKELMSKQKNRRRTLTRSTSAAILRASAWRRIERAWSASFALRASARRSASSSSRCFARSDAMIVSRDDIWSSLCRSDSTSRVRNRFAASASARVSRNSSRSEPMALFCRFTCSRSRFSTRRALASFVAPALPTTASSSSATARRPAEIC